MYYKFANLFIITYLLLGCSSYKTAGFIVPQNNKYIEEYASDGNSWYWAKIPLEISEPIHADIKSNILILQLPDKLKSDKSLNGKFYVILKGKPYTKNFLNKLNIILSYNKKEYIPSKKLYGEYASFVFPITVKDIQENNVSIIIQYGNYQKIVPIEYKVLSYQS